MFIVARDAEKLMSDQESSSLRIPNSPKVQLKASDSMLLVMDTTISAMKRDAFAKSIPVLNRLLQKARSANLPIVYTYTKNLGPNFVQDIAPVQNKDIVLESAGADKFFGTKLEELLSTHHTNYPIMVGTASNGAVLYTAFEAALRGFAVVVVSDCISADSGQIQEFTKWQLLNSPGRMNKENKPLAIAAVTLVEEKDLSFV
jgi:nicotinamidase-related amidase